MVIIRDLRDFLALPVVPYESPELAARLLGIAMTVEGIKLQLEAAGVTPEKSELLAELQREPRGDLSSTT